jgi:hypothetical protein
VHIRVDIKLILHLFSVLRIRERIPVVLPGTSKGGGRHVGTSMPGLFEIGLYLLEKELIRRARRGPEESARISLSHKKSIQYSFSLL